MNIFSKCGLFPQPANLVPYAERRMEDQGLMPDAQKA